MIEKRYRLFKISPKYLNLLQQYVYSMYVKQGAEPRRVLFGLGDVRSQIDFGDFGEVAIYKITPNHSK
jgi:hypothetical protein